MSVVDPTAGRAANTPRRSDPVPGGGERPRLGERFEEAVALAALLHRADLRKGTAVPYVSHLLSVCALVLEDGGDEDEAIAALLHDAVEDAPDEAERERRRATIHQRFGARVASTVEECSDTDLTPKPPWRARKEAHLAHVRADASASACRVIAADKLHNARSLLRDYRGEGETLWRRFNAGPDETRWYYRTMVEALRERLPGQLVEELADAVAELERLVDADVAAAPARRERFRTDSVGLGRSLVGDVDDVAEAQAATDGSMRSNRAPKEEHPLD